ncbi:MAG: protein translocase subunit SecD [Rubellimicrobium sp.]|nr:protein translocase subunit SecD [Rubellimicrobium sp.]
MMLLPLWQRVTIWLVCLAGLIVAAPNAFYQRVETANDARAEIARGITGDDIRADAALWPTWLPHGLVNLGLDLRGGAHLLAEVQVADVYEQRMEGLWPEVRDALVADRDSVGPIQREEDGPKDELRVRVARADGVARALDIVRGLAQPVASLTAVGAKDLDVRADNQTIIVTLSEAERAASDDRTVNQALEIVRRRIDEAGTREPNIVREGADRILIQVPGVGSAEEVIGLIGQTAQLTFHSVVGRTTNPNDPPGPGNIILPSQDEGGVYYVVERTPVVGGDDLVDAQPTFDQNGRPAVSFRFNPHGARIFGEYTANNIGSPFAIVLDDKVVSAPVINSAIPGGSGIITGSFSIEESTQLSIVLRAGALPAELTFIEQRTIGPELGQDSIDAGKLAGIIGFAGVVVYMVLSYGLVFGMIANIALGLNVVLLIALMSMIGGTLTLPGIAGIVLTMGMAVDANVLIYERAREKLLAKHPPNRAMSLGYDLASSAIWDANITTLISAGIMFSLGSGPIRGFAVTLGIGIFTTVFTAVFVSRVMTAAWMNWRKPQSIVL